MEKISLDRWLSLVANFGVLIGIILLIIELDQNRDMLKSQTKSELAMGVSTLTLAIASNEQYADVLARGRAGEPLTPVPPAPWSTEHRPCGSQVTGRETLSSQGL